MGGPKLKNQVEPVKEQVMACHSVSPIRISKSQQDQFQNIAYTIPSTILGHHPKDQNNKWVQRSQ
eukprot:9600788-Prorocentrum_lima.AAC.1